MARICAGRTVLIIAHRLSALRNVKRIVCLHDGRIVEDGPPAALAVSGGLFAAMQKQQGVQVPEIV